MSKVSLIEGDDRYQNISSSLENFREEIILKLKGKKKIVIKPDLTSAEKQDLSIHFEALKAVLDFFFSISSLEVIVLGFAGIGDTEEAFKNFEYYKASKNKNLKFVSVKKEDCVETEIYARDLSPIKTLIPEILLEKDFFKISISGIRMDDRSIAHIGIRNITNSLITRPLNHDGYKSINLSIAKLMTVICPDFSIVDAYQGMEGDFLSGDSVYLGIAFSGFDFVSVDTIGSMIIGLNPYEIGYLSHCVDNSVGVGEIAKIKTIGNTEVEKVKRKFRKSSNYENQL